MAQDKDTKLSEGLHPDTYIQQFSGINNLSINGRLIHLKLQIHKT